MKYKNNLTSPITLIQYKFQISIGLISDIALFLMDRMSNIHIPPPLILAFHVLVSWFTRKLIVIDYPLSEYFIIIPIFFFISGVILVVSNILVFKQKMTTIDPFNPYNTSILITTGLHTYSRNPIYLGLLFILIGSILLHNNILGFALIILFIYIMNIIQIIPEEKALEKLFGQNYLAYKQKVRRWI